MYKDETIDHIIEAIHIIKTQCDNEVHFLLGGDLNHLEIDQILDAYGSMKQIVTVPTRKSATLEMILTDMHSFYHPPATFPPLEVDVNEKGKNSDHEIVVMAPLSNSAFKTQRIKREIVVRPLHPQNILDFGKEITAHDWKEVLEANNVDDKVTNFHQTLHQWLEKFFPEKMVKISSLDRKWMTPNLKILLRRKQREFLKNRKSSKWRNLDRRFKKLKRSSIKNFYSKFVSDLKQSDPGKWYQMAKRLGSVDQMTDGQIQVNELADYSDQESANKIAEHFAAVSNTYNPIDIESLPCYLPAQLPPQVDNYRVYQKLSQLKVNIR